MTSMGTPLAAAALTLQTATVVAAATAGTTSPLTAVLAVTAIAATLGFWIEDAREAAAEPAPRCECGQTIIPPGYTEAVELFAFERVTVRHHRAPHYCCAHELEEAAV